MQDQQQKAEQADITVEKLNSTNTRTKESQAAEDIQHGDAQLIYVTPGRLMHYAQTANCRTQVIRTYFGEAEGEPCLRCDNCAKAHGIVHHFALEVIGYHRKKHVGSDPIQAVASPISQQSVTHVETPYGEIQTTAPETLLHPPSQSTFRKGDEVRHKQFGTGTVIESNNHIVLVDFIQEGSKRLREDFLEAIA